MNKSTLLTILLVSAICLLADSLTGWALADLGNLASVVLSILFLVHVRKHFGAEAENARISCLASAIVNGIGFLSQNSLGFAFTVFSFGLLAWVPGVIHGLESVINICFGIWQLVAWSKLNNIAKAPVASA